MHSAHDVSLPKADRVVTWIPDGAVIALVRYDRKATLPMFRVGCGSVHRVHEVIDR